MIINKIMDNKKRIKSFTDLYSWQEGHKLVLDIYKITKEFPKDEVFCLTSQLRRAAISFTSNIAEGFSRNYYKEKTQFYFIALGSLTEVQSQLLVAKDIDYITEEIFGRIYEQTIKVSKITNGLIKSSKNLIPNS